MKESLMKIFHFEIPNNMEDLVTTSLKFLRMTTVSKKNKFNTQNYYFLRHKVGVTQGLARIDINLKFPKIESKISNHDMKHGKEKRY